MEEVFVRSWWVVLFTLICYAIYERGMAHTDRKIAALEGRLTSLEERKQLAVELQKDLHLQIGATEDPAWIELTLRRVLGLAPKAATKVIFEGEG